MAGQNLVENGVRELRESLRSNVSFPQGRTLRKIEHVRQGTVEIPTKRQANAWRHTSIVGLRITPISPSV